MGRDDEEGDEGMTEEMAERTLTSVAEIRRVMGEELLVADECYVAAADRHSPGEVATWRKVAERLIQACVRLGAGRPVVCDFDCIEWED